MTAEPNTALAPLAARDMLAGGRRCVVLVLALLRAGAYVAEPFAIPSESMAPTLRPGDHVLVEKLSYRFGLAAARRPRRVPARRTAERSPSSASSAWPETAWRSRTASSRSTGTLQREPYVDQRRIDSVYFGPVVVPRGDVFVMGDNRADSHDSRDYGAVPRRSLIGRVLTTLWPVFR